MCLTDTYLHQRSVTANKTLSVEVKPLLALNNLQVTKSYVTPAVWTANENWKWKVRLPVGQVHADLFRYLCKTLWNSNAKFWQLASVVVIYNASVRLLLIITALVGYSEIIFHCIYTSWPWNFLIKNLVKWTASLGTENMLFTKVEATVPIQA